MNFCYGIDLGTTYSAIGRYDPEDKRVEIAQLEREDGTVLLPSVVFFQNDGNVIVGSSAARQAKLEPERVIIGVKRSMGDNWETQSIDGKQYAAYEVSAEILKALKEEAKNYFLDDNVKDAVITVPAWFGESQKFDTKRAAELAGLNVIRILEEPSAAAMAFAIDRVEDVRNKNLLVYDLGGGTFDVCLIHTEGEELENNTIDLKIKTLAKGGNRRLGGLNWNDDLADFVIKKCKKLYDYDPSLDAGDEFTLNESCEREKRHLSRLNSVTILADKHAHEVKDVSREDFERVSGHRLEITKALLETVLEEVENPSKDLMASYPDILPLKRDNISVLLCGGSTRMPMVEKMLTGVMGKPSLRYKNPDHLVVFGASYVAYLSMSKKKNGKEIPAKIKVRTKDGKSVDIQILKENIVQVGKAIGVSALVDERNSENFVVIKQGAKPKEIFSRPFGTSVNNQTTIKIDVYEGNDPDLSRCVKLGEFDISNLPPNIPKGDEVKVQLCYDDDGIIKGRAWHVKTGKEVEIVIDRGVSSMLSHA